jgi:hypothetical protein
MALHKASKVRVVWRLVKGVDEMVCEVWSRGGRFELRVMKSGEAILLEEARTDNDVRRDQATLRADLELLGWTWVLSGEE